MWITPDLQKDMHDGSVAQGDAWVKSNLPTIFHSAAWGTQHSLLIITVDEDDGSAGNQVPMIMVSNDGSVKRGYQSSVPADHYSLLRTIEVA